MATIHQQADILGNNKAIVDINAGDTINLINGDKYEVRNISIIYKGSTGEAYAVAECDVTRANGKRYIAYYLITENIEEMFNASLWEDEDDKKEEE